MTYHSFFASRLFYGSHLRGQTNKEIQNKLNAPAFYKPLLRTIHKKQDPE